MNEQRSRIAMIESLLDRNVPADRKKSIQLYFANETMKSFDKLGRLSIPDRPDELMLGHEDLRDFIARVMTSNRVSPQDRAKGALFGSWREAILRVEGLNAGRVEVLIHLARLFEPIPEHASDFSAVVDFAAMTWGLMMPPVPDPIEARKIAPRITRNMEVLPMILRDIDFHERAPKEEPKRGGEPTRITQTRLSYYDSEEDEDDREEAPF